MSVIAWDGKTVAADRQGFTEPGHLSLSRKLHRQDNGEILATAGPSCAAIDALIHWYTHGADPAQFPEIQKNADDRGSLWVFRDGHWPVRYSSTPYPTTEEDACMAWGSGAQLAIGAMMAGADAVRAVELTNMRSAYCGYGVDSFPCTAPAADTPRAEEETR